MLPDVPDFLLSSHLQKLVGEFLDFAGKSCGKFGGNFAGFSDPHKMLGKFQSIFRKHFRNSKTSFVPTSLWRGATLKLPDKTKLCALLW